MKNLQKNERNNTMFEILLSIVILSIAIILLVNSEVSADSKESSDTPDSESLCIVETVEEPPVQSVDIPTKVNDKSIEEVHFVELKESTKESKQTYSEESEELGDESTLEDSEKVSIEPMVNAEPLVIPEEDFKLFCYVAYAEAGGESYECIVGTMWEIRNGAVIRHQGDFRQEIYFPNRYSCVISDGNVLCGQGIVTDELIPEEFKEIARQVIAGEIPDPTGGALCYLGYDALGYPDPDEFAEKFGIDEYIVLGGHIFFYEWTEELNNL